MSEPVSGARRQPLAATAERPQVATYLYCVIQATRPPDLRTAPGGLPAMGKPRALDAGQGLWLIVADAPISRYGEVALARIVRDLDAVSKCAVAHSAVVAHCARRRPVLPMRLFTLFSSDARALAQVGRRRRALGRRLAHVAGRAEWGVQARLEREARQGGRGALARARRETSGLSPGTRFLELRRRQREATHGVKADARTAAAALYRSLAREADAARQRPPISQDAAAALLLDAAFLVRESRAGGFRRAVSRHAARAAGHGLHVRLTGPWPPYSFVAGRL